jgi:hypothetical protein
MNQTVKSSHHIKNNRSLSGGQGMNRRASVAGNLLGMKYGAAKVAPQGGEGKMQRKSSAFNLTDVKNRMERFKAEESSNSDSSSESEEPSDNSMLVAKSKHRGAKVEVDSGDSSESSNPSSSSSSDKTSQWG